MSDIDVQYTLYSILTVVNNLAPHNIVALFLN